MYIVPGDIKCELCSSFKKNCDECESDGGNITCTKCADNFDLNT